MNNFSITQGDPFAAESLVAIAALANCGVSTGHIEETPRDA